MKKVLSHFLKIPCTSLLSIILTLIAAGLCSTANAQYLHRSGKKILDGDNNEIILRGMGLGGWMLQEGYMLETSAFANAQYQIRAKIKDVVGTEAATDEFYTAWLENHVTKRDIDSLAAWGFNSIRLPMHYNLYTLPIEKELTPGQNTWLEKGFEMTDKLLEWCEANEIYLILDLHAAPGGQGHDAAISDYDATKPSLWESEANKQKTIALWKKLAERYATKKWIGGYDLLNETNWNFTVGANANGCSETASSNAPLKNLLVAITAAIRQVDTNHLIFIEGNCWANNHAGLFPMTDTNIAASFHKYWNYNDQGSIQGLLSLRDAYNLPLWMGESGENSNTWFTNAINLLESNGIGWSWWPMKKIGGINSPFSVVKKQGYQDLLNYWQNGTNKPSAATAKASLLELAEGLKIDNVLYRKDVADAMIRQVQTTETIPYKHHTAPGVIAATDFDLGRYNYAYKDADTANYHVTTGTYTAWNNGWSYRNDGVDIEASNDNSADANGYNVGWTADNEWLQYTIDVQSSAAYNITVRYGSPNANTQVRLITNGNASSPVVSLPATGGYQVFGDFVISDVILPAGTQKLRLYFVKGGANFSLLKLAVSKPANEAPFKALVAETTTSGDAIFLTLNKAVASATLNGTQGFAFTINGNAATIQTLTVEDDYKIKVTLAETLSDNDQLRISYNADDVKATDESMLEDFTNLTVQNNLPYHIAIPAKIEAEAFVVNQGLQPETTTDTGGGQNLGYTNAGDYLEYRIRVSETGNYPLEVRIACNATAGILKFEQRTSTGEVLNTLNVNVPVTGGWQSWQTVTSKMKLDAGAGVLRVTIVQPEFNINWFNFKAHDVISDTEKDQGSLKVYPNPSVGQLFIDFPKDAYHANNTFTLKSINGSNVSSKSKLSYEELTQHNISSLPAGFYVVEVNVNGKLFRTKVVYNGTVN